MKYVGKEDIGVKGHSKPDRTLSFQEAGTSFYV